MTAQRERDERAEFAACWLMYYRIMKAEGARDISHDKAGVLKAGGFYYDCLKGKVDKSEFQAFFAEVMKKNLYFLKPQEFEQAVEEWRRRKVRPVTRVTLSVEQEAVFHKYFDARDLRDIFPPETTAALDALDSSYCQRLWHVDQAAAMSPSQLDEHVRSYLLKHGFRESDFKRIDDYQAAVLAAFEDCRDSKGNLILAKLMAKKDGILRSFGIAKKNQKELTDEHRRARRTHRGL